MRAAVIVFPGSNCDHDCEWSTSRVAGFDTAMVWHKEKELPAGVDAVILPGGFSYGDYLRCGAIASLSPVMGAVKRFRQSQATAFAWPSRLLVFMSRCATPPRSS